MTSAGSANYSYDAAGNRAMTGYTTDVGNRIQTDATWNYVFDDQGNLTKLTPRGGIGGGSGPMLEGSTDVWTYGYDHKNRLVWVEKRDGDGGGGLQVRRPGPADRAVV